MTKAQYNEENIFLQQQILLLKKELAKKDLIIYGLLKDKQNKMKYIKG